MEMKDHPSFLLPGQRRCCLSLRRLPRRRRLQCRDLDQALRWVLNRLRLVDSPKGFRVGQMPMRLS